MTKDRLMKDSTATDDDKKKNDPQAVVPWLRALGYLERRAERIFESQQAIARIQGAIRETMVDIANLLMGSPSGGRPELERAVGNLQGLANAVSQVSAAAPLGGGDSGGSRGAEVDLSGLKAAVETRANSSNGAEGQVAARLNLQDTGDAHRKDGAKIKELSSADAATASGADKTSSTGPAATAPGDAKPPVGDAPVSKADRFKLAFANGDGKADPSPSASSDVPLVPEKPSARSNAVSLKLDHAEAVSNRADAPPEQDAAIKPPKQDPVKPEAAKPGQGAIHSAAAVPRKSPVPAAP